MLYPWCSWRRVPHPKQQKIHQYSSVDFLNDSLNEKIDISSKLNQVSKPPLTIINWSIFSYDKWLQTFSEELTRCWSLFSSLLLLFTCNFCLTRNSYLTTIIIKHHNNTNTSRYLCWTFDASLSAQNTNRLVYALRLQIGGTTNSLLSD